MLESNRNLILSSPLVLCILLKYGGETVSFSFLVKLQQKQPTGFNETYYDFIYRTQCFVFSHLQ